MASVDRVALGQTTTFSTLLTTTTNTALVLVEPASYMIRDHNSNLVLSGTAQQDNLNPALWSVIVTIPSSAPLSNANTRYSIEWIGKSQLETVRQKDYFTVVSAQDFQFVEQDQLIYENSRLSDTLVTDRSLTVTAATVRVVDFSQTVLFETTLTNPVPITTFNNHIYSVSSPDPITWTAGGAGATPYVIEWIYTANGVADQRELHFVYIVNPKLIHLLFQLRSFIDKAKSQNPNPALNYTDVDLMVYLYQGAQMLNGIKPVLTSWTPVSYPQEFEYSLLQAAAYCALSAQYLAEGQAAFEFSGQSVSLSVDRTGFIDSALGRIMDHLNNQVPSQKRMYVRSGGGRGYAGALGINFGPSTTMLLQPYRLAVYQSLFGQRHMNF